MKQEFIWSKYVRFQKGEEKTLVCNTINNTCLFLSNETISILEYAFQNNLNKEVLYQEILDDEDQEYIKKVVNQLMKKNMLKECGLEKCLCQSANISWDITNQCNLHCKHCCVNAGEQKRGTELPTVELLDIGDKILAVNPRSICISGGEPLVRTDFMEIITALRTKYMGTLKLMTNATLINRQMASFIAEKFDTIDISLDGVDEESCSKIRGKNVFGKVIEGINFLQEKGMQSIFVSMVLTEDNYRYREEFIDLCKNKLNVKPVLRVFDTVGRGKENMSILRPKINKYGTNTKSNEKVKFEFKRIQPSIFSCKAAITEFQIAHNGDIFPCASLMQSIFKMGNMKDVIDFKKYIEKEEFKSSKGYKKFESYLPYNISKCKKCKNNLFCFSCVREVQRNMENNNLDYICKSVGQDFNVYWEE